jgi:hypothetical protein
MITNLANPYVQQYIYTACFFMQSNYRTFLSNRFVQGTLRTIHTLPELIGIISLNFLVYYGKSNKDNDSKYVLIIYSILN